MDTNDQTHAGATAKALRLLKGGDGKPRPCPAPGCHHSGQGARYSGESEPIRRSSRAVRPGQRHKKYPGGPWCDGKRDPLHDHALEAYVRVRDALDAAVLAGDHERVLGLCAPVLRVMGQEKGATR